MLKIDVYTTRINIRAQEPLTVGLVGARVRFFFAEGWKSLGKIVVFRQGQTVKDQRISGDQAQIPWEVLQQPGVPLEIGVYGTDAAGKQVIPTLWVRTNPVQPAPSPVEDPGLEPTAEVWQQAVGSLGDLGTLETQQKTDLVSAINEVNQRAEEAAKKVSKPEPLTFTGATEALYDGSGPVSVKIPEGALWVTVSQSQDGTYGANTTFQAIRSAHISGRMILCHYGEYELLMTNPTAQYFGFTCVDKDGAVVQVTINYAGGVTVSIKQPEGTVKSVNGILPDKQGNVEVATGTPGKDGVSVTHQWNGTVLEVTSASGTSSVDLKGEKGNPGATGPKGTDGYTPVKGVDYFTEGEKAEMVQKVQLAMDTIPSCWQTALEAGAKAINTALCAAGHKKSAFLFYSDAHWGYGAQMAPKLLKYLHRHTAMNKTFFGGDIVNSEASDYETMKYLWDWRSQIKDLPNHHSVVGNHDDGNSTNGLFSEEYVYGYLLAAEETPDLVRGDKGLYYYLDSPAEKTRYLCLDTGYQDLNGLSDAQAAFIKDALKSTPEGWHIVAVAHIWYMPDYDRYDVRPIPIAGFSATASAVVTILDSYNARQGEFAGCGAKVEFCIGGHVHIDHVDTTDGGIPVVVVETDSWHIRSGLSNAAGTATEAAVSGVIADYNANVLKVVRVGRGNGFTVDLASGETTQTPDSGDEPVKPAYTNVLDTVGYQTGYRINSSGKAVERADRCITGFIKAKPGDIIYFKNIDTLTSDYGAQIAHYTSNSEGAFITNKSYLIALENQYATWYSDGKLKSIKIGEDGTEYVRFCFVGITGASIITVNEAIE